MRKLFLLLVLSFWYAKFIHAQKIIFQDYFESILSEYKPKGANVFYYRTDTLAFEKVEKVAQAFWDTCFLNYCGISHGKSVITGMSLTDHKYYKRSDTLPKDMAYSYYDVMGSILTPDSISLHLSVRIDSNFQVNRVSNYIGKAGYLDLCQIKAWRYFSANVKAYDEGFIGEIKEVKLRLNWRSNRFEYLVRAEPMYRTKKSGWTKEIQRLMYVDACTGKVLRTESYKVKNRALKGVDPYSTRD